MLDTVAQTGIRSPKTCRDTAKQRRQAARNLKAALIAAVQGDFCNMKQPWLAQEAVAGRITAIDAIARRVLGL